MAPRVAPMTTDVIEALPSSCRECLFWELGLPRPDPRSVVVDELAGDHVAQKQAWCQARAVTTGPPGRAVWDGDTVVGYALFSPPKTLAPRRRPAPQISADALQLATVWVEHTRRERGVGTLLVQAAIKEALKRDLAAVEAYGDRRHRDGDCLVPIGWLLHEGFEIHREHPRYPLLRLDVKRTARWAESFEHALEEIRGHLPRRVFSPVPTEITSAAKD